MGIVVVAVIVVVLLGLWLLVGRRRAEQQTLTFAEAVRLVDADLPAGAVAVAATDGPVRVHQTVRWALTKPETSERVTDGVLRIEVRARQPWLVGGEVSYRIEAPAATAVRVSTGAGAVDVDGISGEVDVRTSAGRVTLANLSGRVRATTQAGQVRGTGLTAVEVDAQSNAGEVRLAFDAPPDRVEARTNAGSVELVVPDQRYAVDAGSYAGRARIDVVNDPAAPHRLVAHSNAGQVLVRRR